MPFISSYHGAMRQLASIHNGNCKGRCRQIWVRNLKNALKSKKNPLHLKSAAQKKAITKKLRELKGKKLMARTQKKYADRNSPPFPANKHCGKEMKGNDGLVYISTPNKNNICSWKKSN